MKKHNNREQLYFARVKPTGNVEFNEGRPAIWPVSTTGCTCGSFIQTAVNDAIPHGERLPTRRKTLRVLWFSAPRQKIEIILKAEKGLKLLRQQPLKNVVAKLKGETKFDA